MKNKLILLLRSFRNKHGDNLWDFFKKWASLMWCYLKRKPVKIALFCQPILGLILTLTIPLCIGRQGKLPKFFIELMSMEAYVFLLCFGAALVLLPMVMPFKVLHCIKLLGLEAMRFAMSGAALVAGLIAGMVLVFAESGEYQNLLVCIAGVALMTLMVLYCAFGLTYHKTCESIEPKPGRKWWQAGALAFVIFLAYSSHV